MVNPGLPMLWLRVMKFHDYRFGKFFGKSDFCKQDYKNSISDNLS